MRSRLVRRLRGLLRRRRSDVVAVRSVAVGSWWILDGELLYRVNGECRAIAEGLARDPYFYPERRPCTR